jgi:CHAT domain-containing protein
MMKTLRQFCLLMGFILFVVTFASSCQKQLTTDNKTTPDNHIVSQQIEYGKTAFRRGDFALAIYYLDKAISSAVVKNDPEKYIDTSLRLAAAYQNLGRLKETHALLKDVLPLTEENSLHRAEILMQLSDVYLDMRNINEENMTCGMHTANQDLTQTLQDQLQSLWLKSEEESSSLPKTTTIGHRKIVCREFKRFEEFKKGLKKQFDNALNEEKQKLKNSFQPVEPHQVLRSVLENHPLSSTGITYIACKNLEKAENALETVISSQKISPRNEENIARLNANLLNQRINLGLLEVIELRKTEKWLDAEIQYEGTLNKYEQETRQTGASNSRNSNVNENQVRKAMAMLEGTIHLGPSYYFDKFLDKEMIERSILQQVENDLSSSHSKALALINLAELVRTTFKYLSEQSLDYQEKYQQFYSCTYQYAYDALLKARAIAIEQQDNLALTYANLYLARLYAEKDEYSQKVIRIKDSENIYERLCITQENEQEITQEQVQKAERIRAEARSYNENRDTNHRRYVEKAIQLTQEAIRYIQSYPFYSRKKERDPFLASQVKVYIPSFLETDILSVKECRKLCQEDYSSPIFVQNCKGTCQPVPSQFLHNYHPEWLSVKSSVKSEEAETSFVSMRSKVYFPSINQEDNRSEQQCQQLCRDDVLSDDKELETRLTGQGCYGTCQVFPPLSLQNYHPELLFKLEWQLARFMRELLSKSDSHQMITRINEAYERADTHLQQVRQWQRSFSEIFRDKMEQFYRNWADFVLQHANKTTGTEKTERLKKAIEIIEAYKATEIRNFFKDECITEQVKHFKTTNIVSAPKTVVFYPIVFDDRVELLLSSVHKRQQFVYRDNEISVIDEVNKFSQQIMVKRKKKQIDNLDDIHIILQKLYKALINPILDVLKNQGIETIIVVPDDNLREIPFAALHDGEEYLIQNYAVVVEPGIQLVDMRDSNSTLFGERQVLLAGSDFRQLDDKNVSSQKGPNEEGPLYCVPVELKQISCIIKDEEKPEFLLNNQDSFCTQTHEGENNCSLSKEDMRYFESQFETREVIFGEQFVLGSLKQRLERMPYSTIHLSTHGYFGKTSEDIYLLDGKLGKITMPQLKRLIRDTELITQPIQLLTLSACETAKGDNRATLGLAGVTLSAGVRSALATLWVVEDQVATELMVTFYENLQDNKDNPKWSKAKALQEAQKQLLSKCQYKNPYYWAPFILIGNWL